MACYLAPMSEAIVTTVVSKVVKRKESHSEERSEGMTLSRRIGMLSKSLWGGSALLAYEHLWHGEISPFYPFLSPKVHKTENTS